MTRNFDSIQVTLGRGSQDRGALHQAINVAQQMFGAGIWNGEGRLIIHDAYDVHRQMSLSGEPEFNWEVCANVYPGVHELVEGQDYEVHPLPDDFWEMHQLPNPHTNTKS